MLLFTKPLQLFFTVSMGYGNFRQKNPQSPIALWVSFCTPALRIAVHTYCASTASSILLGVRLAAGKHVFQSQELLARKEQAQGHTEQRQLQLIASRES